MEGMVEIPSSGYRVRPVVDGNAVLLGDPLTSRLIDALTRHEPVVELWALWTRDVGSVALLRSLPHLQQLHVINRTKARLSEIADLKGLRVLTVESNTVFDVDLTFWPSLRELAFAWGGMFLNLSKAKTLATLRVWSWKQRNLDYLSEAPQLRDLLLVGGSLRTLKGIELCHDLEKLTLSHIIRLEDFSALQSLGSLRVLKIDACRGLHNVGIIAALPRLQNLYLENLGNVDSLRPLSCSRTLRKLYFRGSTNIVDGDTDIVNRLPLTGVAFRNRKHYNYKWLRAVKREP
jgi:hypothetical protein